MYSLSVLAGLDRTSLCLAYQPLLPTLPAIDKIYIWICLKLYEWLLAARSECDGKPNLFVLAPSLVHGKFTWGDHQQHAGSYLEAVSPA